MMAQCLHLILYASLGLVLGYGVSQALSRPVNNNTLLMRDNREQLTVKYRPSYKDLTEKEKRFNIFKENVERFGELQYSGFKSP